MTNLRNILSIVFFIFFQFSISYTQSLPKVFLVGENEESYEKMMGNYTELLLTVSDNSMDKAYDHWITLLSEIENYSSTQDYDIKGVKIWLNVFWNKSGEIDHLVYYPKPNSRNIDFEKFTQFLAKFIYTYRLDIRTDNNFSHYGSASFPIYSQRNIDKG